MALPLPRFSFSPSRIVFPKSKSSFPTKPISFPNSNVPQVANFAYKFGNRVVIRKVSKDEDTTTTSSEEISPEKSQSEEMTELGEEIKKAMKEREQKEETGFLSGVLEEIQEIEWPPFDKVLGTTGVVLGVIAGSSIVLLTVNAVLSELSDRVFAGRGVQDFFG